MSDTKKEEFDKLTKMSFKLNPGSGRRPGSGGQKPALKDKTGNFADKDNSTDLADKLTLCSA